MLRFAIVSICVLGIEVGSVDEVGEGCADRSETKQRVAICLSGPLRTFPQKRVFDTMQRYLLNDARWNGLRGSSRADVFVYSYLGDSGPKHNINRDFDPVVVNRTTAENVLSKIHPVSTVLFDGLGSLNVTAENVLSSPYIKDPSCYKGYYAEDPEHLARAVHQFSNIRGCIDLVTKYEKKAQENYDTVILVRPDVYFTKPLPARCRDDPSVWHMQDFLFLFQRQDLPHFVRATEMFRQCSRGMPCCGCCVDPENMFYFSIKPLVLKKLNERLLDVSRARPSDKF